MVEAPAILLKDLRGQIADALWTEHGSSITASVCSTFQLPVLPPQSFAYGNMNFDPSMMSRSHGTNAVSSSTDMFPFEQRHECAATTSTSTRSMKQILPKPVAVPSHLMKSKAATLLELEEYKKSSFKNNEEDDQKVHFLEDQLRLRGRDYYGIPVKVNMASSRQKLTEKPNDVICDIQTSKRWRSRYRDRKNKNPLKTRLTVRALKNLLEKQEKSQGDDGDPDNPESSAPSTSYYTYGAAARTDLQQRGKDAMKSLKNMRQSAPYQQPTASFGRFDSDVGTGRILDLIDPSMVKNINKRERGRPPMIGRHDGTLVGEKAGSSSDPSYIYFPPTNSTSTVPDQRNLVKSFSLAHIEIGSFRVPSVNTENTKRLTIYASRRIVTYDFDMDVLSPEGTQSRGKWSIVVPFESMTDVVSCSMGVNIHVRRPPLVYVGTDDVTKGTNTVWSLDQDDFTNGQVDIVLAHSLTFFNKVVAQKVTRCFKSFKSWFQVRDINEGDTEAVLVNATPVDDNIQRNYSLLFENDLRAKITRSDPGTPVGSSNAAAMDLTRGSLAGTQNLLNNEDLLLHQALVRNQYQLQQSMFMGGYPPMLDPYSGYPVGVDYQSFYPYLCTDPNAVVPPFTGSFIGAPPINPYMYCFGGYQPTESNLTPVSMESEVGSSESGRMSENTLSSCGDTTGVEEGSGGPPDTLPDVVGSGTKSPLIPLVPEEQGSPLHTPMFRKGFSALELSRADHQYYSDPADVIGSSGFSGALEFVQSGAETAVCNTPRWESSSADDMAPMDLSSHNGARAKERQMGGPIGTLNTVSTSTSFQDVTRAMMESLCYDGI